MDPHANRELTIFREFAAVCPLQIEAGSIEKRDPPEADILCRIADGTAVAFEMVELVDQRRIAKPMADQDRLMDTLREAGNSLPQETRNQLASAWVGVKFRLDRSFRNPQGICGTDRSGVGGQPDFEGEFSAHDRQGEVARANVKRPKGLAGPHFASSQPLIISLYRLTP